MGKAIVLKDISFSENNLGTIKIENLESISIIGPSTITSENIYSPYSVIYNPANTLLEGVTWSIVSGNAIILNSGVLIPYEEGTVIIQATSIYNSYVISTKEIDVQDASGGYMAGTSLQWSRINQTTYIDTEIIVLDNIGMDVAFIDTNSTGHLCLGARNGNRGSQATNSITVYLDNNNGKHMTLQYMAVQSGDRSIDTSRHSYKVTRECFYFDSEVIQFPSTPTRIEPSRTTYIGSTLNQPKLEGSTELGATILYSMTLDSNVFIPVKRVEDDTVGMYCRETNTFIDFSNFNATLNE